MSPVTYVLVILQSYWYKLQHHAVTPPMHIL